MHQTIKVSQIRKALLLLLAVMLPLLLWPGLIANLFSNDFMPHIYCLAEQPALVRLHVVSDLVIGLSYVAISVTLGYFVYRRKDLPFSWVFLAFGLFIIACGVGHFLDVWTLWSATYWLSGSVKLITATVSVLTAFLLPPLIPKAVALPSPDQLEATNRELQREIAERIKIENTLKATTQRFRSAFDHAAIGKALVSPEGRWLEVNISLCNMLGYSEEELLDMNFQEITYPDDLDVDLEYVRQMIAGERETYHMEKRFFHKKRHIVWGLLSVSATRNQGEEVELFIFELQDITARKEAEEALRASEARFSGILDIAEDAIISIDQDHRITLFNQGAERIFGYAAHEAIEQPVDMLLPASFVHKHRHHISEFGRSNDISRGMMENREVRGRRKDGSEFFAEATISKLALANELTFTVMLRDITARKQTEQELKHSEQFVRAVLNSLTANIAALDKDGKIVATNDTWEHSAEENGSPKLASVSVGVNYLDVCRRASENNDRSAGEALAGIQRVLSGSKKSFSMEYPCHSSRKKRWFMMNVSLIGDAQGGVVISHQDITTVKTLEKQLFQSQKMEAMGTLAGGIAHDFNNILAAILGYSELIASKVPADTVVRSHLDQIQHAGNRAKELVKQILAFSRQQEGEYRPMKLQAVANDALKLLRASLPSTIEISQYIDSSAPAIRGDAAQLHQVIMNLGVNALQAMSQDGGVMQITLDTIGYDSDIPLSPEQIENGCWLRLSIKDNGHGMDRNTMERIFDPFFTTKPAGTGTGLGLTIVHSIVRKHGGEFQVYSEPGVGTTFNIYFPVYEGRERIAETRPDSIPIPRGDGRHILLVDDEEALILLGKEILEQLGYKVTALASSVLALEKFRSHKAEFDLVMTDYIMPQVNGFSLARSILEIRPDIPIILVTGNDLTISPEMLSNNGITQLLIKPYNRRSLGEAVHQVLRQKKEALY